MRTKVLCARAALALCLLGALLFAAPMTSAIALEVPRDAREAHIPVVLPVSAAIAGGEVEFSQTDGLRFLRFEPADTVRNPVSARVGEKTYVGFFSEDNEYQPVDGTLFMGDLVFEYTGNEPERVTLSMFKLHTKVDTGTGVDTRVINSNTVIPVSRVDDDSGGDGDGDDNGGGNPGSGDDGSDGGSDNGAGGNPSGDDGDDGGGSDGDNNGGAGTGGTGNAGGGGASGGGASGGNGSNNGVYAVAGPSDTLGTAIPSSGAGGALGNTSGNAVVSPSIPPASPGDATDSQGIDDDTVPLASSLENGQVLPVWMLLSMAAALLLAILLLLLLWRGKRRQEAMTAWDLIEFSPDEQNDQNDQYDEVSRGNQSE